MLSNTFIPYSIYNNNKDTYIKCVYDMFIYKKIFHGCQEFQRQRKICMKVISI